MNPITLEEAIPALETNLAPLEETVFNESSREKSDFMNQPDLLREYKEALIYRINFTAETIDFIKELQTKYQGNAKLMYLYNRYSDGNRQLRKIYNKL